jgi:hypothetical protein
MSRSREVIAERFAIEQLAGFGGVAQVYRARDRMSGNLVALKVMHDASRLELGRFAREAQVLATLSHPGIVRYIDSGLTAEGEPYLAVAWLSGEPLTARLQRTQLALAEILALGRRVASALSALHRHGVVHRDITPNNLFLLASAIDKVTLIDFGMACRPLVDPRLTVTGTMLGTPGYIAPEQVDNVANLDGRADIFSLGCVLYRCLSGRPPFRGPDALRTLLNGTADQLPRLRELRPSIPRGLDDLVARMLARSPTDRPRNADVVTAELLAVEDSEASPRSDHSGPHRVVSAIRATERRLTCLVLARLPAPAERPRAVAEREAREAQDRALREVVERHRGKLEILANGSLLAILSNADAATDLASRAARCAVSLRRLLGNASVVVVSGREVPGPGLPDGELLDRAVALLETTEDCPVVRIDELTSALSEARLRRKTLHDSLVNLEEKISSPAAGRIPNWTAAVLKGMTEVRDAFAQHVIVTEKPGGLYDEILERAPRLAGNVRRLREEHPEIVTATDELIGELEEVEIGSEGWPLDRARDDLQRFIGSVIRHRQRGADLVWEAYNVDIGGLE